MKLYSNVLMIILLFIILFMLMSCGTPQPPGEDLWRML